MEKLKLNKATGTIALLIITIFWGGAYVATKYCQDSGMPSGLIIMIRGGIFCLLTFLCFAKKIVKMNKKGAIIGISAGLANGSAYLIQCIGLETASPSTGAFLTVQYVVIVPILLLIFFRKKIKLQLLPAIVFCIVGIYILTGMSFSNFKLKIGEILTLISAVLFAVSIMLLGEFGNDIESSVAGFWMGFTQMIAGLVYFIIQGQSVSGGMTALASSIDWASGILPLLFLGIFCTFTATNVQIYSLKVVDETAASIIMTLEAFFAGVLSLLFGFESFSWRLAVGGGLILLGTIIAELDFKKIIDHFKNRKSHDDCND